MARYRESAALAGDGGGEHGQSVVAAFRAGIVRDLVGERVLIGQERENEGMDPFLVSLHHRLGRLAVLSEGVHLVNLTDELADVGEFEVCRVRHQHTRFLCRLYVPQQIFHESVVDETLECGAAVTVAAYRKEQRGVTAGIDQSVEVVQEVAGGQF